MPDSDVRNAGREPLDDSTFSNVQQLGLQSGAFSTVALCAWLYGSASGTTPTWPWNYIALLTGCVALLMAHFTGQPWWWKAIHALFAPLAWMLSAIGVPPYWYLSAFLLLLLSYRGALSGRIPLFFSSAEVPLAIIDLVDGKTGRDIVDLGAGIGSVVKQLALRLPESRITGIENSFIPWLCGRLRTSGRSNCTWAFGNFWQHPLARYDVVYAFLSPEPMPALWEKLKSEMRPGSLFITNSFPVPGQEPEFVVKVDDARQSLLYCYTL